VTRCRVCGARLDGAALCTQRSCRWKDAARRARARRSRQLAAVIRSARRRLAQGAARYGVQRAIPIAVLPANLARLTPLPARRHAAFRAHLLDQIREAAQRPGRPLAPETDCTNIPPAPIAAGCATCRGRCCTQGGEHAFVDFTTIRRFSARTGITAAPAIVRAYLRHLPTRSYRDSCVYHTAAGCNLPRQMRGDVCNQFYCGALLAHWQALIGPGTAKIAIAAADGSKVVRLSVVTTDERA
jgi:hypothetical protein